MAKINYQYYDGHREMIEVTEEFAEQYAVIELLQQRYEEREKKRRKRHFSYERMLDDGFDFHDYSMKDPLDILIEKEQEESIINIISLSTFLTAKQRRVMDLYYEVGYTKTEIAKVLNISQAAVTHHISAAIKKILKNI